MCTLRSEKHCYSGKTMILLGVKETKGIEAFVEETDVLLNVA